MHETRQILNLILGADSPLKSFLPSFAPRQEQLALALAASQALADSCPLVAQVGTGSGKTLGYLVPALLSGLKTIVSTGTKTLQEQISIKELPLLQKTLSPDLRWAVLKGRTNYLCVRKIRQYFSQAELANWAGSSGQALKQFWQNSPDGDLDQIRDYLPAGIIEEITSNSEQCLGGRCPERDYCFLMEARRKAQEADVVLVNHHLFMADLVLKSQGPGQLLPRWQGAIFDEAHLLPEIATQAFAVQVSQQRVMALLRDIARESSQPSLMAEVLLLTRQASDKLFGKLARMLGPSTGTGLSKQHLQTMLPLMRALEEMLTALTSLLGSSEQDEMLAQRIARLEQDIKILPSPLSGHTVAWARTKGSSPAFMLSPVEVAPHLQESLYNHEQRLIFTSATLAPLNDLSGFVKRMGLDGNVTQSLSLPSPFNLAQQAKLYVPRSLPEPGQEGFIAALVKELQNILSLTQGRAFVLFTSRRNLDIVAAALHGKLPFHLLVQGQAPKITLIEQFIENSPAVLLATASFWQGVDIPGPSLSAVIVDKLPFAPPDDPLVAARCQLLEENGGNGFAHILVPEAILSLKQGLGRLIRSSEDRGILAVMDSRIWRKSYGKRFLRSLAPVPVTDNLAEIRDFFKQG